ncbi:MAG: twin-arginine translocase subunit TatC [Pyrinomonadaceae bacterium]
MNENAIRKERELGGNMSFLAHLDELRRRLVYSALVVAVAFIFCWKFSGTIYEFLSVPVRQALSEAERRQLPVEGLTGTEKLLPLAELKLGATGRYIFERATNIGSGVVSPGASVDAIVATGDDGNTGLFTNEAIFTNTAVIPKGVRLPVDLSAPDAVGQSADERLIITTAGEGFTLYVTVSLYAAIALTIPFLLWQIWAFISPALYKHERSYVTPFIALSTISFVIGAAFAYYVLFPPAISYLLGVAEEFRPLLRASDYFDFITIIMLAMGLIFQMPAITYVLARIGIISANMLVKSWKLAVVVILIVAAVVSPTGDIPNLLLFSAPMFVLYVFSIFIAWFFGKARRTHGDTGAKG